MTHDEISVAVHTEQKARREAQRVLMAEYNIGYYARMKELRVACEAIGHKWHFTHLGPLNDPWFVCGICRATKVEIDSEGKP